MSGFDRIAVGTGSPEGVNSVYVLADRGVVIDPGPPTAWTALRSGLERSGLHINEIEHVIVTHWHADHAGLACRLASAADATLHMHEADAPLVGTYAESRVERIERDRSTLERWGVPTAVRDAVINGDTPSPLPDTYPIDGHHDGDTVAGLELIHTPGHTAGHTSIVAAEAVFLGDLLLPTYTPNVGGSDTRLDDPLGVYLQSLDRLSDRAAGRSGEPGHGTTLPINEAVETVRAHHRERAKRAYKIVAERSNATPWTVATELFGHMAGVHAKFGPGEAAAHLDRLAEIGVVDRIETAGEPVRYAISSPFPSGTNLTP